MKPEGFQKIETCPRTGRKSIWLWREGMDQPNLAFANTWWYSGFSHGMKPTHWKMVTDNELENMKMISK